MAVDSVTSSPLGPPACEKDAKALQFIEDMTRNPDAVQERVLGEILSQNAETEYLKKFGLNGATDRHSFKSKIPVVKYEDLQPEIQRIANGDRSPILSSHPISEFLTSSGTSAGERKLMPTIEEEMERRQQLYNLLMPVMNLYVPGLDKGKGLYFLFVKASTKTPGGLLARPVLTAYYNSKQFKNNPYDPYNVCTSPLEAVLCTDSFQSMYTQMLCGLIMRHEVLRVGAVFASGLLRAIRFLQINWKELAYDISTGILNPKVTEPSIRERMSNILKADQQLADFITKECSGENWDSIITRIWPNTKYLEVIVTGAMAQYIPTLDYYSGGLPKSCTMYASSECYFGLNLKPMCKPSEVSYTIMPNMAYFEFMPHNPSAPPPSHDSPPRLVELVDVEVGKEYELVVSTYSGLSRYRVGDILEVTGFHNLAPQFRFVRRKNVLLSIESDKTDEAELQKPSRTLRFYYVNSTRASLSTQAMRTRKRSRTLRDLLGTADKGSENGTFEELMDYAISRGASINQYKVPRCVNFTPIMELLDSRVVSVHFSPAAPHWTPERRR
ncbi:hypothetical protein FNV43_RR17107 [Rhamnella rubrinervis]|uniref:Uncharacterized protein n=1 Tax=Rhamnella rubrinervis TaxID=2594499 RepID=A0A8K0E8Q6_9ROSA|nr:hypothetical protein FNV43_RR17107 [Rhamnella rubrinervis]